MKKLLILVASIIVIFAVITYKMSSKYDGVDYINSTYGNITIYRDHLGIPHLFADNEKAALFGTGYMHAQDRIWTYEKFRRLSQGILAEVLGDEAVPLDYLVRQFGFLRIAKKALKTVKKEFLDDYEIYVQGINEYLEENPLPIEFYVLGYD